MPRPLALGAFSVTKRSLGGTGERGSGEVPSVGGVGDAHLIFGGTLSLVSVGDFGDGAFGVY